MEWLADHKARNGGKIRVSQGGKGVRVMFSKDADMALWQRRSEAVAEGQEVRRLRCGRERLVWSKKVGAIA